MISNKIHTTAVIGENVVLGENNVIGPYCVLNGNITLGNNNILHPGVVISNTVNIGNGNEFFPYAVIGGRGEMGAKGDRINENGSIQIGNNNVLREYVTLHSPYHYQKCEMGNDNYIMNKVYLAHDFIVENNITISAGCSFGGRSTIQSFVNVGMGTTVHQRITIGAGSMVGMQSAVNRNIVPFSKVAGVPVRILGVNKMGAQRMGYSSEEIEALEKDFYTSEQSDKNNKLIQKILEFKERYTNILTDKYKTNK